MRKKNAEHAQLTKAESRDFSEERGSSGTLKGWGKEYTTLFTHKTQTHASKGKREKKKKKEKPCTQV